MTNNRYLVWLDWPERCFRANADDIRYLRTLVPRGARIDRVTSERDFLRLLPLATHAVVWRFKREWFARAPRLKLLATPAAGREFVPSVAPKGVVVHFGGFHGAIISETVLGFVLAWAHGFFRKLPMWPRSRLAEYAMDLKRTKAVILGYGRIGRAIGAALEGVGVSVVGIRRRNFASLRRAASSADWLVLALPGDTGTDDILGKELIRTLPKRAVVINVGRGNAVDERELLRALKEKRLAGAYLDVFKTEPGVFTPRARAQGLSVMKRVPPTLVRLPHASAFSARYIKLAFKELRDDGVI